MLLAVLCVVLPPAGAALTLLPSVEARLEVELECLLSLSLSRGLRCMTRPPPNLMLRGLSPASFTEEVLLPAPGALLPGFGIPLWAGVEFSFLAALLPLGIKLVIFEAFLMELSESTEVGDVSSFESSTLSSVLSGTEVRFPTSFPFSFSFSFSFSLPLSLSFSWPLTELFLAVNALLKVRWAMPLRAILGLLAVVGTAVPAVGVAPLLVPFIPGLTLPSSSSRQSVLEAVSTFSTCPTPTCLAGAGFSVWGPAPVAEDFEAPLLLKSFSFSSIDFGGTALGGASAAAALLEFSLSCLMGCMAGVGPLVDEVEAAEACLELMDLLRHGLLLPFGCGMAVQEVDEEEEEDEGGFWAEVAAEMLVEEVEVTTDDRA